MSNLVVQELNDAILQSIDQAVTVSTKDEEEIKPLTYEGTQEEWNQLPSVNKEIERVWEAKCLKYLEEEKNNK